MNCTNCGAPLPQGAATCPNCGASNPYNISGPAAPYNPYGTPSQPQGQQNYPNAQSVPQPPTGYGPPQDPYSYPQSNPYGQPNTPPYPPYGNTVPNQPLYGNAAPNQAPYGNGASNPNAAPYGTPNAGYGYQQGGPAGTVPGMPGGYGSFPQPVQPAKRRSRVGLIIGIVILVLVLACGGLFAVLAAIGSSKGTATTTTTKTATPATTNTPATSGVVPTANQISPSAAAILTQGQTTSAVDSNYLPTKVTQNFTTKQTVYLTFQVNSQGNDGYISVKWYLNGQLLTSDKLPHSAKNDHGYFSLPYNEAGQGAAAMYWGTKADLSDAQLALVVNFNVS